MTPEAALKSVARNCLAHLQANAGPAAHARDPEFLHQVRVAVRRMRSALRLCHPADRAAAALREELRWLSASLGPARDWDVLLEDTLPPILTEYSRTAPAGAPAQSRQLVLAAQRRHARARAAAREALDSARFAALAEAVARWVDGAGLPDLGVTHVRRFASEELSRDHQRLMRKGEHLAQLEAGQRHAARIAAKRLRYALEFFGSLFPARLTKRYAAPLAALQESLGQLNDNSVALRLVSVLPGAGELTPYVTGWLSAREPPCLAAAGAAFGRLRRLRPVWAATD